MEDHMARSDLLESLVKAGTTGDKRGFRTVAEAIIAEERAKRHDILADRLLRAIQPSNGNGNGYHGDSPAPPTDFTHRGRDFIAEINPRKRLEDLILPSVARQSILEGGFNNEVQRVIQAAGGWDGVASRNPHRQARVAQNALPPSHPRRTIPNFCSQGGRLVLGAIGAKLGGLPPPSAAS